jgi:hypothetical protein
MVKQNTQNDNTKNKFIIDREINLNEYDFLKTKVYSDSLTQTIKNTEDNKVFTIGLFGNWGTGKSSIVKTSEKDFDNKKVKFVTYDAWQYNSDSFRRMFLRKLKDDLKYEETDLMRKFYENEFIEVGEKYQLSNRGLAIILCSLIIICVITTFVPFDLTYKFSIYGMVTLFGLLITIISGAFNKLKISITKPHLFAPEQFEDCFREIITHSLKKTNFMEKAKRWINADKAIKDLDKLVIVIDNIDRCSNDIAYNLLTDIKTFLSSEPFSIVFIIPVDDEALRKHILGGSIETSLINDKEEFLRKFFNVVIRIKPYGETDIYSFAKNISEMAGLNLKNETINLATKEYAKNPRRVIQLFNNLEVEFTLYNDIDFVEKNETLICAMLILREEFDGYYKRIVNTPQLFIDWRPRKEKVEKNMEFNRFVRVVHNVIDTIDLSALNKILTNSSNIFAPEIREAIDTFDIPKVIEIFTKNRNIIIDYLIHRMSFAVKNNLLKRELPGLFDIALQVNEKFHFEKYENLRIVEKLSDNIDTIIANSKVHEEICRYALTLREQGIGIFQQHIIDMIKRKAEEGRIINWKTLFNAALKHFSDKEASEKLNSLFAIEYKNIDESIVFSPDQWNYLVTDEFVQNRIHDISDVKKDSNDCKMISYLFSEKKNITTDTYSIFFKKITEIIGNLRGKSRDEIFNYIKFINSIIIHIPNIKLRQDEPKILYDLIVNDRKMPRPGYPTQYDTNLNFVSECLNEQAYISEIFDFAINIYRITKGNIGIDKVLEKIIANNRNEINKKLLVLLQQNFTLESILSLIFQDTEYGNENTIILLKHCLCMKDDNGIYSISDTEATTKLGEMLNYAYTEKSDAVFEFLESISDDRRYRDMLSNLIVKKDSIFINNLPKVFLNLAVQSFTDENYNDYIDNFDLLSVIALHGTISQKELLIKILISKIDNNDNFENVMNILNVITNIYEVDPDGLLSTHLSKYKRENKDIISDELKKQLDHIVKKIKAESKSDE